MNYFNQNIVLYESEFVVLQDMRDKIRDERQVYKDYFMYGLSVLLTLGLFSCGSDPQVFDRQVFHYNQSSGISSLDPVFARDQSGI